MSPASSAARQVRSAVTTCSSSACAPVAHRTQAIKGRDAERAGEVPVRAAAGHSLAQLPTHLGRDRPGDLVEASHRRRPLERRPREPAADLEAGPFERGPQRLHGPLEPAGVFHRRGARIDDGPGVLGHDVGTVAPLDEAHVQRQPASMVPEGADRPDLRRQLVYGARAPGRIDAGVRWNPAHPQLELAAALAAGLDRPFRQGRLQHEDGTAPAGFLFDQSSGGTAAPLLVRGPQHDRARPGQPPDGGQGPHGQHPDDDARLHVEHARSVQAAALLPQRHPLELPDGPDGIEVPQQHDLPLRRAGPEGRAHVGTAGGRGDALDGSAHLAEMFRQSFPAAIDGGRIGGRGLQTDELGQYPDQPVVAGIAELVQRVHWGIIRGWDTTTGGRSRTGC